MPISNEIERNEGSKERRKGLKNLVRSNRKKFVEEKDGSSWVIRAHHRVARARGCFDRSSTLVVARTTTTIKVVSVDRDVTLPVACRSTFIAVIQPRIERPTAERRNGNTQWFSREPVENAIDRSLLHEEEEEEGRRSAFDSWKKTCLLHYFSHSKINEDARGASFQGETKEKREGEKKEKLRSSLRIIERRREEIESNPRSEKVCWKWSGESLSRG